MQGEVLHGENIFQEEETSDRAALVTNARHNPFDFDLNNPPGFDLNEAPSPEPPTPPHIQGRIFIFNLQSALFFGKNEFRPS